MDQGMWEDKDIYHFAATFPLSFTLSICPSPLAIASCLPASNPQDFIVSPFVSKQAPGALQPAEAQSRAVEDRSVQWDMF